MSAADSPVRLFTWTTADKDEAGLIAFTLGVLRQVPTGEAIMELSVELRHRYPRLSDAWRFFNASALLFAAKNTVLAASAQRIGARIALAVTGWTVVDMCLAESGRSAAFGVYVKRQNWDEPRPFVLEISDNATGETKAERVGMFTPQIAAGAE